MEPDALALRTALFTLLGLVLLGICWVALGERPGEFRTYLVRTSESVSGLAVQSRVYYKGVEAGSVQDIFFAPQDYNHVQILIQVNDSIPIAQNTFGQLALRGLTGEYDLRLDNDGPLGIPLETSAAQPAVIPMKAEYITQLGSLMQSALQDVSDASAGIAEALNTENQEKLTRLLTSIATAAEKLGRVDDLLAPTLEATPAVLESFKRTAVAYENIANALNLRTQGTADALAGIADAGHGIDSLTGQLNAHTLPRISESLDSLDRATTELAGLVDELRQNPQQIIGGGPPIQLGPGEIVVEAKP